MKQKTFVLTVSKTFPRFHPRAGESTDFGSKILCGKKIHTIRANYDLWENRVAQVCRDEAIISIRQWTDKPYRSKMVEIAKIDRGCKPTVEFISMHRTNKRINWNIDGIRVSETLVEVAENDGLSCKDFGQWFFRDKDEGLFEGVIIHFTKFRYRR